MEVENILMVRSISGFISALMDLVVILTSCSLSKMGNGLGYEIMWTLWSSVIHNKLVQLLNQFGQGSVSSLTR